MRIGRFVFVMAAVVLAHAGCRGCDEPYQAYLRQMSAREGVCYATSPREAADAVRAVLAEQNFPLAPPAADQPGLIATGWKDTTVYGSRLTSPGRPKRARREVLLGGGACLRFAVRAISQSTPKEGPDYAEMHYEDSFEEGELATAIHERLKADARPWQPPP